jgi:hypothetical protein
LEKEEPTIVPFKTVRDKTELEHVIRAAQVATLNPRTPPTAYMEQDVRGLPIDVDFSPNLVVLNVSALRELWLLKAMLTHFVDYRAFSAHFDVL